MNLGPMGAGETRRPPRTGAQDGDVRIWTPGQESFTRLTGSEHPVTSTAFSPDGERLAVGFANGALEAWRLSDGRMLYRKSEHSRARLFSQSPTTGGAIASSLQGRIRPPAFGSAATGRLLYTLRGHGSRPLDRHRRALARRPLGPRQPTAPTLHAGRKGSRPHGLVRPDRASDHDRGRRRNVPVLLLQGLRRGPWAPAARRHAIAGDGAHAYSGGAGAT